jgi:hypothetical protein
VGFRSGGIYFSNIVRIADNIDGPVITPEKKKYFYLNKCVLIINFYSTA